jgi:cellulose synthase (UDP-forming)
MRTRQSPAGDALTTACVRQSEEAYLSPLMNHAQKVQYWIWVAFLLGALAYFWFWWLRPEHNIGTFNYALNLVVVAWVTLLPLYLILIVARARVLTQLPVPPGYRVAMVVTKAPSEPFPLVRETLEAMLRQTYPHHTWLADEDPGPETIKWCREHGVMISTRKGRADYHNKSWPRRTKCKEGNLAFFYDHYGYANYDFVVQLDADHVPTDGYLEEMLRGFADPKVGYVSAPSICDKNADESWSARSRLYVEGALHGALQAGYTGYFAPLCIGSHYAVRTKALEEIGGLGPELAEDHSTTLIMNAHGWHGVHAMNAIAHGDGPKTFGDLATQEFQWSRSLFTIFLKYTPLYFRKLPPRLKFQFAFCQLWYPLFSVLMLVMYLLPLAALLLDTNMVGVSYPDFFVRTSLLWIVLTGLAFWCAKQQWMRPAEAKVTSWEGILFLFARWPWSLIGTIAAVIGWMRGSTFDFRVTPKGHGPAEPLPLRILAPYAFLSIASGLPVLLLANIKIAFGFYIFAILNSALYAALLLIIVVKHRRENPNATQILGPNLYRATVTGIACVTIAIPILAIPLRGPVAFHSLVWGYEPLLDLNTWNKGVPTQLWRFTTASAQPLSARHQASGDRQVRLGIYDPTGAVHGDPRISIEHIFVEWQVDTSRLRLASRQARERNRQLMLTVEPWPWWRWQSANSTGDKRDLFAEIMAGHYDTELRTVCREIGAMEGSVLVRWGHEMERGRYPWAGTDGPAYIQAFRYFVDKCRVLAPNALFVWSPKGEEGAESYYPGDAYVDYVGLSIYAAQEFEIARYGKSRSAIESLSEQYARVSATNKPVMIAELGVAGDKQYMHDWLMELSDNVAAFPLLCAIVYFNEKEPYPLTLGSPDWRLGMEYFLERK